MIPVYIWKKKKMNVAGEFLKRSVMKRGTCSNKSKQLTSMGDGTSSEYLTFINYLTPHNNPMRQVSSLTVGRGWYLLAFWTYKWQFRIIVTHILQMAKPWHREVKYGPKFTQLAIDRIRIYIQTDWLRVSAHEIRLYN